MKGRSIGYIFLVVVFIMSLFLTACSNNETKTSGNDQTSGNNKTNNKGEELAKDQTLNLYSTADFTSLDTAHASDAPSFDSLSEIRAGLVTLDVDGNVVPDMAASMPEVSKDGLVYTFKLRDDIKWSNGDPVTADNFVYAWQREIDPKTAGEYSFIFPEANIKNAAKIQDKNSDLFGKVKELGIEAVDQKTVKITLDKPTPFLPDLLTTPPFFPLNQQFVEKQGDKFALEPDKMLSNGAFILTKWDHGQGWSYKKNENYWNAANIKLETVNYKVLKDMSTTINIYQTGALDYVQLNSDYLGKFLNSKDLHKKLSADINFIRLNESHPALANENIRDAIYNAIDRDGLVKLLLKDGSVPARYVVPKEFAKGPDGKDFRDKYPQINEMSLDEAKASWEKGLEEIGKKKVTIELMIGDTTNETTTAEYYKGQLEKNLPGLTVNINKQPYGSHLKLEGERKYDMSKWGWLPDYRDPMTYLDMWVTDAPFNRTGYSNPKFDKMIEEAKNSGDKPEKRWELMQEAEKILLEDAAVVPTHQTSYSYLLKPYVKNLVVRNYGPVVDWKYAYVTKH